MNYRWLEKKRKDLEARIARLSARAERIEAHLAVEARFPLAELGERAQLHDNDEVVAFLGLSAGEDLAALEAALARHHAGTYGTCTRCHGTIAEARLDALPATPHCSRCAKALARAALRGVA